MIKKNLKKLFAVVVSLTILLSLTVPAMAAVSVTTAGEICEFLGVLKGAGNGVDNAYLNTATTRAQGATILLRLQGKEDEAKAYQGTANFSDVVGNEWFAPLLAYVKANPSLGFQGYPDGTFKPNQIMTVAELAKVLLTALGYVQGVDYEWADVVSFAQAKGLISSSNGNAAITNNVVAEAILATLQVEKKDGSGTLVEYLIAEGVISAADANEVGLITQLAILSAKATNSDEITVTFNRPVEGDPVVNVKSGLATVFTSKTWSADKTQVVIKKSSAFTAATYQVVVGNMAPVNVTVSAAVPTTVEIVGPTILKNTEAAITVNLYNQYGKKINTTRNDYSITAFNRTKGGVLMVDPLAFKINTDNVAENEVVTVTVMHNSSTLVAQADLTVVLTSQVSQFALTGVVNPEGQTRVYTNSGKVVLTYAAYDQYGVAMKITSKDGLTFASSNSAILDPSKVSFDSKGVMTFEPGTAGTANLSVLVNAKGALTTLPVQIFNPSAVETVTIGLKDTLIVSGEKVEMNIEVRDQFGNVLNAKDHVATIASKLTYVSSRGDVVKGGNTNDDSDFSIDANGVLSIKPVGVKGSSTVYYRWDGKLIDSFVVDVNETAKPVVIESITYNGGIEKEATQSIVLGNLKVLDQYGRVYKTDGMNTDNFTITANPNTLMTVAAKADKKGWDITAGVTPGAVKFTVEINNAADSANEMNIKVYDVYDAKNGVTYKFGTFPVLFSNATVDAASAYAKKVEIIGTASDGTVITLKQDKIANLTSSNAFVKVTKSGNEFKLYSSDAKVATSTVRAYDASAKLLCTMDVTTSIDRSAQKVAYAAAAIEKSAADLTGAVATIAKDVLGLKVTDQYGVELLAINAFDLAANGFFASNNSGVTFAGGNVAVDAGVAIGTKVVITYTTNTGMQASVTVTIKA